MIIQINVWFDFNSVVTSYISKLQANLKSNKYEIFVNNNKINVIIDNKMSRGSSPKRYSATQPFNQIIYQNTDQDK